MTTPREPTGFLEERPGVRSMARLCAGGAMTAILLLTLAACGVAWRDGEHASAILLSLAGFASPIAGGMWAALRERSAVDGAPSPESP